LFPAPAGVGFELEGAGFDEVAGNGGVRSEALEGGGGEFPAKGGGGLGDGGDAVFEEEGEIGFGVAGVLVDGGADGF